jgi:hypothetical protein
MTLPPAKTFYADSPLYQRIDLNEDNLVHYFSLVYFPGTIDCYCVGCGADSIFTAELSPLEREVPSQAEAEWKRLVRTATLPQPISPAGLHRGNRVRPGPPSKFSAYKLPLGILLRAFGCGRNADHKFHAVFHVGQRRLTKIGQIPSSADLTLPAQSKFRKILGDFYPELHRAVGLNAHGVGIGAFVYLRRIFESLVQDACAKAASSEKWSVEQETEYQNARMAQRIQMLRHVLPGFLVENAGLYGILSKGVHELSEQECLAYFDVVRQGIELVLENRIAEQEKQAKTAEAAKAIEQLRQELEKPKKNEKP